MAHKSDWIIWNGGERPVSELTYVQYQLYNEDRERAERMNPERSGSLEWNWKNEDHDIVAYRVIE